MGVPARFHPPGVPIPITLSFIVHYLGNFFHKKGNCLHARNAQWLKGSEKIDAIGPAGNSTYTIDISGTGPFVDTDFSEQANDLSYLAALDLKNHGSGEAGVVTTFDPQGTGEPVPEPSTLLLLGSGLFGLMGLRKRPLTSSTSPR